MAFFAESTVKEDQNLLDITVNEYTDFDALALEACDTIQEMDNAIMQGIGRYELSQVTEGTEVVYTEGMYDTIKEKLSKIWEFLKKWVKSVWNKFITWIGSYIKGDQEFVKKYEKQIKENLKYLDDEYEYTLKYKGVFDKDLVKTNFTDNIKGSLSKALSQIKNASADKIEDVIDTHKKAIEDEYEELTDKFSDTQELNKSAISGKLNEIIAIIKEDISEYKKIADGYDKTINDLKKEAVDKWEASKADSAAKKLSAVKNISNAASSAVSKGVSFTIKLIKYRKSAARAICRKILIAKPNPKYNESTAFEHTDFDSYFTI